MRPILSPSSILLPCVGDMTAWSVIACDQFTSQRDYWEKVEERVGGAPSSLRLVLPEAWLGTHRAVGASKRIASAMERYLADGVFEELPDSMIYLERTQPDGQVRRGLLGALDLEAYDFTPGTHSLVRATEGTVGERLPPRVEIRRGASLEMPHAIVLMDDREDRVMGPLEKAKEEMTVLYDFDLMMGGGHLAGWLVRGDVLDTTLSALESLGSVEEQKKKYGPAAQNGPLVFAVGDGNHSLAAAKRYWEELKPTLTEKEREEHPARYSLVEVENIHEPALSFEPIHRLITGTETNAFSAEIKAHRGEWEAPDRTLGERVAAADAFCRNYIRRYGGKIDYIHGDETARTLGEAPGCGAVLLPPVEKDGLFLSVLTGGALPRKSFSMGHARDKRYYLECRRIR